MEEEASAARDRDRVNAGISAAEDTAALDDQQQSDAGSDRNAQVLRLAESETRGPESSQPPICLRSPANLHT